MARRRGLRIRAAPRNPLTDPPRTPAATSRGCACSNRAMPTPGCAGSPPPSYSTSGHPERLSTPNTQEPHPQRVGPQVGNLSDQKWGISVIAVISEEHGGQRVMLGIASCREEYHHRDTTEPDSATPMPRGAWSRAVSRIEWTDAPPAAAASSHPQGRQDRAEYPPAGRASLRIVPRGCRCSDLDPGCRGRTGAAVAATACRPTELCAARPEPAPVPDRLRPRQERRIRRR